MKSEGVRLIEQERRRQVDQEEWTAEHDDKEQNPGDLALAGARYAEDVATVLEGFQSSEDTPRGWPWNDCWWKPTPDNPIRQLTKAGALIAAEIDRIYRQGFLVKRETDGDALVKAWQGDNEYKRRRATSESGAKQVESVPDEARKQIEALNKNLDLKNAALKTALQEHVNLQAKIAALEERWGIVKPYIEGIVAMWKAREKREQG